jgi:adenylate kinase
MSNLPSNQKVVIIMGPPGSGKGTQANLVADKLNLYHLDTGKFLEELVHDPNLQGDPEVQKEKGNFDSGILVSPLFFLKWVTEKIQNLRKNGMGIIFSGSPRTMLEGFGDAEHKGLMDVLADAYGKENILIFLLQVPDEESVKRNSTRVICSVCGNAMISALNLNLPQCPVCGGSFRTRTLDKPEVIKVRLDEFKNRTFPIIAELEKRRFKINKVDGNPMPYQVFEKITSIIDDTFKDR